MQPKRQTAFKLWISDILSGEEKLSPEGFKYFLVKGREILRVNIIAAAIHKYENPEKRYTTLTLDDGTGQIRVKAWDDDTMLLDGINIGDIVLVVAKLHSQNNEIFLRPEIVRKMGMEWAKARNMELRKQYGQPDGKKIAVVEERVEERIEPSMVAREKIVRLVESAPVEGMEISSLINKTGLREKDVEKAVEELLSEGEIFSPRPGFVKLV